MPVYNEASNIEAFLRQLDARLDSLAVASEVIIVDGGSSDNTRALLAAADRSVMQSPPGRAAQMNHGAKLARGEYLLFLHADTLLPADMADWWQAVKARQASWGFFALRLSGSAWPLRIIERAITWRSRLFASATGDQAQFVCRALWQQVGGFAPVAIMEDVLLSRALRARAQPLVWPTPVETDSRRWQRDGIVRTVLLMWFLKLAFFCGVKPQYLASLYRRGR